MIVQELFRSLDRKAFIDAYLSYCNNPKSAKRRSNISDLLDALDLLKIIPDNSQIIFCEPCLGEYQLDSVVIKKEDLLSTETSREAPEGYAYEFSSMSEILGYSVSKACIHAFGEYRVACAILYEMTFFGYDIEDQKATVTKEIGELNQTIEDIKNGTAKLISSDGVFKKLGWVDNRKEFEKDFDSTKIALEHNLSKQLRRELCNLEIHYLFEDLTQQ